MAYKIKISRNAGDKLLLLLKPKHLCDSERIAKGIAACAWARRVHITTGEFGFLVDTKIGSSGLDKVKRDICKLARGAEVFEIVSHSTYMQS